MFINHRLPPMPEDARRRHGICYISKMDQPSAGWLPQVTVGVGAVYLPELEGSDGFEIQPFPIVSAHFGDRVHLGMEGLVVDVWEYNGFSVAAKGGVEMGRKEDDSDYLRGLGDVVGGVVGALLTYENGPFEVYASLRKTLGGSEGLTGTVGEGVLPERTLCFFGRRIRHLGRQQAHAVLFRGEFGTVCTFRPVRVRRGSEL